MICKFAGVNSKYQNGNIKSTNKTNLAYVKTHIITIKQTDFLTFENSDDIFVNGYKKKIKFKDLKYYIKIKNKLKEKIKNMKN